MRDRRRDPLHGRPATVDAAQMMGVGIQFAASIVLFLLAGRWLDVRLGTTPLLMVLGVLVGGAAGFYSMYTRLVTQPERKRREKEAEEET
jgi:ATP synthase protein I